MKKRRLSGMFTTIESDVSEVSSRLRFLHASPKKNRQSIKDGGLKIGQKQSDYGDTMLKAIYLYHASNIDIVYELIKTKGFEDFDIWEVNLEESDEEFLIPDEDSKAPCWRDSMDRFGTLAIKKSIPPHKVNFLLNINKG